MDTNSNGVEKARLFKFATLVLIVLSVFLLVEVIAGIKSLSYIGSDAANRNTISVEGEGEAFAVPDIATFTFTVTEEGKTVVDTQEKSNEKVRIALEKLKSLGIEDKDIKTTDYNVYPKYEYAQPVCTQYSCPPGKQNFIGYETSQTILVKVRKVADGGKILGEIGKVNVTNISGLNFTVDDEDILVREARQKAILNAQEKAKALASDLGVRIVRVVNFGESGNYPMPYYLKADAVGYGRGGATESVPQIPTGENKITSHVTVTYEIR